jgi:hypothetical protein
VKKCLIHSVFPRPNKDSKSSRIKVALLGLSGVIRLDCRTVVLPVYTRKHQKYPVLVSHISKVFIPNFEAFTECQALNNGNVLVWKMQSLKFYVQATYHRINFEQYEKSFICWYALIFYKMQKFTNQPKSFFTNYIKKIQVLILLFYLKSMTWLLVSAHYPSMKTELKLCKFHFLWQVSMTSQVI